MVKTRLERIAALETSIHGAHLNTGMAEALNRCCDVLQAAIPADERRYIDCGTFVRCDYTGWRSHRDKLGEMAIRLQAANPTAEDEAILAALPADALAAMKMDAREFIAMLKEMNDAI
jgi:hypothetical protein